MSGSFANSNGSCLHALPQQASLSSSGHVPTMSLSCDSHGPVVPGAKFSSKAVLVYIYIYCRFLVSKRFAVKGVWCGGFQILKASA